MKQIKNGDSVFLYFADDTTIFASVNSEIPIIQSHKGNIKTEDLLANGYGATLETSNGEKYIICDPTYDEYIFKLKRGSQIVYPKDSGLILLKLGIKPGSTVIESGCGSGGMTGALSMFTGENGKVISYEKREDFIDIARFNIARFVPYCSNVEFKHRDAKDGFDEKDVDAVFIDLPDPDLYIHHVYESLRNGGNCGFVVPTFNQIEKVLWTLRKFEFKRLEVFETFLRQYKPNPNRLRPEDKMVGHTAYLIFAKKTYGFGKTVLDGDAYLKQED